MSTPRRLALGCCLTGAALLLPATTALAQEPERTGWWSRASAGPAVVPMPITAEGDLRITNSPEGPAAYSAVLYPASGAEDATLTLTVRTDRTLGAPDVLACVTADTEWPEGGNQPYDAAPAYDCDAGSAFGELAPDGSTLSFLLDAATLDVTGAWSLALVPTPGSTTPFSLELAAPEADSFVAGSPSAEQDPFVSDEPEPTADDPQEDGSGEPFLAGGFAAPPADTAVAEQPLLAGGADAPLPAAAGPAPDVAAGAAPSAPPQLQATPAGVVEDLGAGRRLLALLVLAAGSAALGYAAAQQRPAPRLIGGRARALGTPALATAGGPPSAQDRPRGIGRFAKQRDAAPRRLR